MEDLEKANAAPETAKKLSSSSSVPRTDCADDPVILKLLDFEPVPRKFKREDGWTPALQRIFIAKLAELGSVNAATEALGKNRYGVEKLYKSPGADGFRGAWDKAIALFEEREAKRLMIENAPFAGVKPPFVDRRRKDAAPEASEEPEEASEDQKLELLQSLATKFMKKVAVERQARLEGRIVAADFYLRQITFLEVMFDLSSEQLGWKAADALRECRRGGHELPQIVSTSFSDLLDSSRREWWEKEGDPDRPPHPDVRFLERHGSGEGEYATAIDQHAYGALTHPARGYTQEEWAKMGYEEQVRARKAQFEADAADQVAWEAKASAEWKTADAKQRQTSTRDEHRSDAGIVTRR